MSTWTAVSDHHSPCFCHFIHSKPRSDCLLIVFCLCSQCTIVMKKKKSKPLRKHSHRQDNLTHHYNRRLRGPTTRAPRHRHALSRLHPRRHLVAFICGHSQQPFLMSPSLPSPRRPSRRLAGSTTRTWTTKLTHPQVARTKSQGNSDGSPNTQKYNSFLGGPL